MSTKVDDPVRVYVSTKNTTSQGGPEGNSVEVANRLEQEFVRVRTSNQGVNREAILLALLTRAYTNRVVDFSDTKGVDAHRLIIVFGLCSIKSAELHGNLIQI